MYTCTDLFALEQENNCTFWPWLSLPLYQYLSHELNTLSRSVSGQQNDCADQIRIRLHYFSSSSFVKLPVLTCESDTPYTPPLHNLKGLR